MSYDVTLTLDTGGPEPVECWTANHTSNTASMWRQAGADLAAMDGHAAEHCLPLLNRAIQQIDQYPATFRLYEPPNGWGTVETTLAFLRDLADACTRYPKATVRVYR